MKQTLRPSATFRRRGQGNSATPPPNLKTSRGHERLVISSRLSSGGRSTPRRSAVRATSSPLAAADGASGRFLERLSNWQECLTRAAEKSVDFWGGGGGTADMRHYSCFGDCLVLDAGACCFVCFPTLSRSAAVSPESLGGFQRQSTAQSTFICNSPNGNQRRFYALTIRNIKTEQLNLQDSRKNSAGTGHAFGWAEPSALTM